MTPFADHTGNHQPTSGIISRGLYGPQAAGLWLSCLLATAVCLLAACGPAAAQGGSPDLVRLDTPTSFGPPTWVYQFRCHQLVSGVRWELTGLSGVTGATPPPVPGGVDPTQWWSAVAEPTKVTFTYNGAPQPPNWVGQFSVTATGVNAPVPWQSYNSSRPSSGLVHGPTAGYPAGSIAVTVYDNLVGFGDFGGPIEGSVPNTYVMPQETPASDWAGTSGVPGANGYDIAGLRVRTEARLNLIVDFGGHLTRVSPDGSAFAGSDTRKSTPGPYELATEWKIKFFGKFLAPLTADPFVSPSSGGVTDFDTWTQWGPGSDDPADNTGWTSPATTDAWTGATISGTDSLVATVERMQGVNVDPLGEAAEVWITERVLRRGMQDVSGNYRQDVRVILTVAE